MKSEKEKACSLVKALQFAQYMSDFLAATVKISVVKLYSLEMQNQLLGVAAMTLIFSF